MEMEVHKRWGKTEAYKEFVKKTEGYSQDTFQNIADGLNAIFAEFAKCMENGEEIRNEEVQGLVGKLQSYITENYYTCTDEILAGLGQMYVLDERFRNNIDKHGKGTAEYVSDAIKVYSKEGR